MTYPNPVLRTITAIALTLATAGHSTPTVKSGESDIVVAQGLLEGQVPPEMQPVSPLSTQLGNTPRSPGGTGYRPPRRILTCHRVRYPRPLMVCGW